MEEADIGSEQQSEPALHSVLQWWMPDTVVSQHVIERESWTLFDTEKTMGICRNTARTRFSIMFAEFSAF